MHVRRPLARFALVAALLGVVVAGSATASASAATASLSVTHIGSNQYRVTVKAYVSHYYPRGADLAVRLWGEDEYYDDLLVGPITGTWDGDFTPGEVPPFSFVVSGSTLNEDWGARDELYAGLRVYDHSTGKQVEIAESNRLYGYWS
jgi:hypothetical protein